MTWLHSFIAHITAYRGLAASVMDILRNPESELSASCETMRAAAAKLLARAQDAAAIRPDVTTTELLHLTNGVAVAAEGRPDQTTRLLLLLTEGLSHRGPSQ